MLQLTEHELSAGAKGWLPLDPLLYDKVNIALREDDPEKRAEAISQLEAAGETGAIRMAICHAKNETSKELLKRIGSMARKAGADKWTELIRSELDVCEPLEKCRLLFVMRFLDDYDIHMLAAEQFGVKETVVRRAALKVLDRVDKSTKLRMFKNLSLDQEPEKRLRAIRGVSAFKHPAIVPILKRGLNDSEYDVRKEAYTALQALQAAGIKEAAELLTKVPAPTPPAEVPVAEEAEVVDDGAGEEAGNGRKKMTPIERLLSEGKNCRECKHSSKERTDKKKMAPNRLWCKHLKKETMPQKTCLRGSWS